MNTDAHRIEIRERRRVAADNWKPLGRIRLLLVAEAPPADDRYFYFENVTLYDKLFLGVSEVLLGGKPNQKACGLAKLRDLGVFLIDRRLDPVDGSPLRSYVPCLVSRCRHLNPERIILIKATVYDAAYKLLKDARLPVVNKRVYFPSTGHEGSFRKQFAEALSSQDNSMSLVV